MLVFTFSAINSNVESPVSGGMDLACLGDGSYPDGTEVTPGFEVLYAIYYHWSAH